MLSRAPAAVASEDGLTLVELLVVILIMGVVGGMTVTSLVQGMRTTDRVDARVETMTSLQQASERVARDLRRGVWTDTSVSPPLPSDPAGCTYISLDPVAVTVIVFDGADRFRHSYSVVGDTLTLDRDRWSGTAWVDESTEDLIEGLDNATSGDDIFTYLDADGRDVLSDGEQGSDRASVRSFRLTLVGRVPQQPSVELTTTVAARNGGLTCPVAS